MLSKFKSLTTKNQEEKKQKEAIEYKATLEEAIGSKGEYYTKNLAWLQNRWFKQDPFDDIPRRIIAPVVSPRNKIHPIDAAILADNLEYFERRYPEADRDDAEGLLKIACLSGAQSIATFILKALGIDLIQEEYNYLFTYMIASSNETWVLEVAHALSNAGYKMPREAYGLCFDYKLDRKIKDIFEKPVSSSSASSPSTM